MNVAFYQNKYSPPGADYIENVFRWNHHKLEDCHCYIQWLFPMHDETSKFNRHAVSITSEESTKIRENALLSLRALCSFEFMLDFMGFYLHKGDWSIHMRNINRIHFINQSGHNFLRITRILKSMPYLGLECLRQKFLNALREQILNNNLSNAREALFWYWDPICSNSSHEEQFVPSFAINVMTKIAEDKRINLYIRILLNCKCIYVTKLLLNELKFDIDIPFQSENIWLLLQKNEDGDYIVFHEKSGVIKLVPISYFRYIFCEEGTQLSSADYVGLYLWDELHSVSTTEIDDVLENSYASGVSNLKFVHLIH